MLPQIHEQDSNIIDIPESLKKSKLLRKGGFEVFEGFMNPIFFQHLQHEAIKAMKTALNSNVAVSNNLVERGGEPARKFLSAPGGSYLASFCKSPQVLNLLEQIVGLPVTPSGDQGTFTFYLREGDHLELHRDIIACDLAVITSLYDNTDRSSYGGVLALYPKKYMDSLLDILNNPQENRVLAKLLQGQTIVMLGGIVPHLVLPMNANEKRIVSILCYKVNC